ncbi:MAG: hypothetical protein ABW196_06005 [Solirubrobacterales bacterium]
MRGVFPRGWPGGRSQLLAECLIEGLDPSVDVTARFVQLAERRVLDREGSLVQSLVAAGKRYVGREEAVEHEMRIDSLPNRTATVKPAGCKRAELTEDGAPAGALEWRWEPLHATVEAWIEEIAPGLRQVHINVANRLEWDGADEQAPLRAFYLTAVVLHSPDGAFASLADPPPHLREPSAACHNEGLWPVPVGAAGDRRTVLASPAPLEDYPAPRRRRAPARRL